MSTSDTHDPEPAGGEHCPDAIRLITLHHDTATFDCTTRSTARTKFARDFFDQRRSHLRLEIVDNDHGLSSAMGFLLSQHHSAQSDGRGGWRWEGRFRGPRRQVGHV
jgi:hypothetical protein